MTAIMTPTLGPLDISYQYMILTQNPRCTNPAFMKYHNNIKSFIKIVGISWLDGVVGKRPKPVWRVPIDL